MSWQQRAVEIVNTLPHRIHEVMDAHVIASPDRMALIDDKPRSANATAVSETVCIVVPEKLFKEKIETVDPLIRALLRVLVRNVRAADSRMGPG